MSKYLVRCTVTRSIVVDAEDEEEAIEAAPNSDDPDGWDSSEAEYEAEESDDEEDDLAL